jgi:hypothetical protein
MESRLNVTSILLKKIILEADSETWVRIRKHYLPAEYHTVYSVVNKHFEEVGGLPSFDALKLSVRSNVVLDKVFAIQSAEDVDIDNSQLLEFLKNEYTQEEIMDQISSYLEESIMMESAKENVDKLQGIIFHIEDKVELKDSNEDMQRIELFDSEEDLKKRFALGLNADYDANIKFAPGDYILIGGRRGSGKSLTCSNIAVNEWNKERSSIYFTIEMSSRKILQRNCAIATGIPATSLKNRNLSHGEWQTVAKWWSSRFEGGAEAYLKYTKHHSFDTLHQDLSKCYLHPEKQMDVVYDPSMTLGTIRSELDRKVERLKPSVIIVDYVNQIKKSNRGSQYDWFDQIDISTALKTMAQDYGLPLISPYQTDATGEARFAKGLLDSADAAFSLEAHKGEDNCIAFDCAKMRDDDEISFCSAVDWRSLKIGPSSAVDPKNKKEDSDDSGEGAYDM